MSRSSDCADDWNRAFIALRPAQPTERGRPRGGDDVSITPEPSQSKGPGEGCRHQMVRRRSEANGARGGCDMKGYGSRDIHVATHTRLPCLISSKTQPRGLSVVS